MKLELHIPEDRGEPLYKRVKDAIIRAIADGILKPGNPLPSTRQLADALEISRLTVLRSYEDLASAGWIVVRTRGRTFVSRNLPKVGQFSAAPSPSLEQVEPEWNEFALRLKESSAQLDEANHLRRISSPNLDDLPITLWKQSLNKAVRDLEKEQMLWPDSFGYAPLREAIHALLGRSRSINCDTDQVVIHSRSSGGLDLICRLLFQTNTPVVVEDPGSELIRALFTSYGFNIQPVEVDHEGIRVDKLYELEVAPRLIYVTPSRNEPTGTIMSMDRRRALIKYAASVGAFILEDDFDCEYRYGEKPLPSLQSLDPHGCVIYRYNFWKAMYPLVKLSVNVLPKSLLGQFKQLNDTFFRDVPILEQAAFADFIESGHYERYIQKRHKACRRRRAALMLELKRAFRDQIKLFDLSGGTEVRVVFDESLPTSALLDAAAAAELPMMPTAPKYGLVPAPTNEFTVTFSTLDESVLGSRVANFAAIIL